MTSGEKSLKILVAEDDFLIGELLSDMLIAMGHVVCAVENTEDGTVAAARQYSPELLIVDMHLSPGSGVSAVERIIESKDIPHILVSGNIARLVELRPGATLLEKPYTELTLARAIRRAGAHTDHDK